MCLFFTHIAVEIKGSDYIWGYSGAAKCNTNLFTDVNPNRWGEPMNRPQRGRGNPRPFKAGRRSVKDQSLIDKYRASIARAAEDRYQALIKILSK